MIHYPLSALNFELWAQVIAEDIWRLVLFSCWPYMLLNRIKRELK